MDDKDKNDIANLVVKKFNETSSCPNGMDKDTVEVLKKLLPVLEEIVDIYNASKQSIWKTIWVVFRTGLITIIAIALLGGIILFMEKIYRFFH